MWRKEEWIEGMVLSGRQSNCIRNPTGIVREFVSINHERIPCVFVIEHIILPKELNCGPVRINPKTYVNRRNVVDASAREINLPSIVLLEHVQLNL